MENKISVEVAREQVDLFLDYYDMPLDELLEELDDKNMKSGVKTSYSRIIKAIQKGRIEISTTDEDQLKIIQHVGKDNSETLEYKIIDGYAKSSMKNADSEDTYGKIYSLVGSLTGLGKEAILKLKGKNLSDAECIGMILLQV